MSAAKQVFRTAITATDTAAVDTLGDIRQEPFRRYKYVRFTAAIDLGDIVKYATLAAYDASEVAESATQALVVAGMAVVTHIANNYGWIQIAGSATLATAVTSGSIGDGFISEANLGLVTVSTGGAEQICGWSLNATTGVILSCPD